MDQNALASLQRRTIRTLTAGQVLSGFGLGATLSVGALLAQDLSGSAAWSGAASTFSTLGSAVWAFPLARLAAARGRRISLATGAALAIGGALMVMLSAYLRVFPLLIVALFFLGAATATGLQARFAATDLPGERSTGRDLSLVVWATTIGAVAGPNMFGPGEALGQLLGLPHLTGPFLMTIAAQVFATTVFWFGLRPDPLLTAQRLNAAAGALRPKISLRDAFATLKRNGRARYAVATLALSHMVMVAVMSMTPVHMKDMGASLVIIGFTISLHIAGMYAFSPIFGWLGDKIGQVKVVIFGQLIYLAALAFAGLGSMDRTTISVGLLLLGLGWSAATVSASALLATSLPADEKTNVQGLSDSLQSLSGAVGGATSGLLLAVVAYPGLNAVALIPVCLILIFTGLTRWKA